MVISSRCGRRSDSGSVFIEFAMVIPFLMGMIIGLVELGTFFASATWVAQTSYNMVKVGSETPPALAPRVIRRRANDLLDAHLLVRNVNVRECPGEGEIVNEIRTPGSSYVGIRTMTCVEVDSIFGLRYTYDITTSGPSLFNRPNTNVNLNTFSNSI